jgi:hypothetical protein
MQSDSNHRGKPLFFKSLSKVWDRYSQFSPENAGKSLADDFVKLWNKRFKFRLGAFHPWCLTIVSSPFSFDPFLL